MPLALDLTFPESRQVSAFRLLHLLLFVFVSVIHAQHVQYSMDDKQVDLVGDGASVPGVGVVVRGAIVCCHRRTDDDISQQKWGVACVLWLGGVFVNGKCQHIGWALVPHVLLVEFSDDVRRDEDDG